MTPKRIAAIVTALVLMVIVVAVELGRAKEPTYAGKPLSYWITSPTGDEAPIELAIKEIGVDALPDLIEYLHRQDSPKYQSGALTALNCLGPKARPALPEILPLMTNNSRDIRIQALFVCTAIAPDSLSASSAMPALNDALRSPFWTMRADALRCLNALQPPPPEAAMLLSGRLTDENEYVRATAMECLVARTNPIVIPLLKERLHDAKSVTVTKAIIQLGAFGTAAASAEQRLRELCQDPASSVREAATNALLAVTGDMKVPGGVSPRQPALRADCRDPAGGPSSFHTASRHASWPYQRRRLSLHSFFGKNLPIYSPRPSWTLTVSHSCRFVSVSVSTVS
jgi:HEAT repeat protein